MTANDRNKNGFDSVVSVEWLHERLGRKDVFIADCRFDLADAEAGRRSFEEAHIPGAVYFNLDEDLSAPPQGSGGRHPLPPVATFVARFEERGIGDDVTVVCYDDSGGGMAARLWWMLRYVGHERVALLDGGYEAWTNAGFPVSAGADRANGAEGEQSREPGRLTVRLQPNMVATAADVGALSASGKGHIVDSRAPERYRGEVEPLDPVAGRIPGAVNFPWQDNAGEDGLLLDREALAKRFATLTDGGEGDVVVHCGSGVTGCVNVLAMERAGMEGVKLYAGGWSDWCSDEDNPVETGEPAE